MADAPPQQAPAILKAPVRPTTTVPFGFPLGGVHLAQPTKITLGGVALDVERFIWAYSPGPAAYATNLDVWDNVHAGLNSLGRGPHKLIVRCPGLTETDELEVSEVYLIDPRPADERAVSWRIADRRWWFDYSKFTGRYNLRRRINDVVGLDPQAVFGYNVERYRPYSALKAWDKEGKEVKGPQTALGLFRRILDVCDPTGVTEATFERVQDNGVPVESKIYLEDRGTVIITELLRLAEVNYFVDLSGKYQVYSLHTDLAQTKAATAKDFLRGRFMRQRNHRTRPTSVNVAFLQEQEVEAVTEDAHPNPPSDVYTSGGASNIYEKLADLAGLKIISIAGQRDQDRQSDEQNAPPTLPPGVQAGQGGEAPPPGTALPGVVDPAGQAVSGDPSELFAAIARGANVNAIVPRLGEPILLENVLQIPRTINFTVTDSSGKNVSIEFTRGEWVRVDVAMAAWRLLDGGTSLLPLTEANLQKYWFGNVITRLYSFDPDYPSWADPVKLERMSVLRSAYRRIYRVAKPYLDNIHTMRAERVTIVDPVTRTLALPFVSTQYCEVPNLRPPTRAPAGQARVVAVNKDDYSNDVQSPFTFSLSPEMGIVQLQAMPDLTNLVRERIHGQVNNIPSYDLNPDGSVIWQSASLSATFKTKIILTVQWGSPNDKNVLYIVKKDVANFGGRGGLLEVFSSIDSARIDKDGKIVNGGLIDLAAIHEVRQIMFSHRDVTIGWKHFKGFRKDFYPEGNCRSVQFVVEQGVPYTMYDATDAYTQRPAAAAMDAQTRNFAMRITEIG